MTTTTGRAVLALDELLCTVTPEQAAAFRAMAPAWLLDQTNAAITENISHLQATGTAAPFPVEQHPGWLRLGICDALIRWYRGECSTCRHDPHPARPQPVVAAAWKPGLVVCHRCAYLLQLPDGSVADRTCDACGRIVAGTGRDLMYPVKIAAGLLAYSAGCCRDCQYWARRDR